MSGRMRSVEAVGSRSKGSRRQLWKRSREHDAVLRVGKESGI